MDVEKNRPVSATEGFNFDEIGDGFKNPAPPIPSWDEDVNTSNAGKPVSADKQERRKRKDEKSFFFAVFCVLRGFTIIKSNLMDQNEY